VRGGGKKDHLEIKKGGDAHVEGLRAQRGDSSPIGGEGKSTPLKPTMNQSAIALTLSLGGRSARKKGTSRRERKSRFLSDKKR